MGPPASLVTSLEGRIKDQRQGGIGRGIWIDWYGKEHEK